MISVTFHVPGVPAPQGSKTRTQYGMFEASKRVKPWRELVTQVAAVAADAECLLAPLTPPYELEVRFLFRKPRTSRAEHPVAPTIGDTDKLVRAVGDALTASGLIEDDRHIIRIVAEKSWAGDETPGAVITVRQVGS